MMTLRFPCDGFPPTIFFSTFFGSSTSLNGVSAIDLPAYLFNSGLTSKLSRWLTPPQRKIQITDFAFGAKCGWPMGGCQPSAESFPSATPSRNKSAPNARPVKPIPVSARNDRRVTPQQGDAGLEP